MKSSSQENQDKRYEHAEQKRQELINNLKQLRADMIKAEEEAQNTTGNQSKEGSGEGEDSAMIQKEKQKLENMKKQQIGEIKNMIDYEIEMNEFKKKNEEKMRLQQEREKKFQEQKEMEKREREEKQRKKEEEQHKRQLDEEKANEQKIKEREEKEEKMRQEEEKKKKERQSKIDQQRKENAQKQEERQTPDKW